jgi:hypothetical protein
MRFNIRNIKNFGTKGVMTKLGKSTQALHALRTWLPLLLMAAWGMTYGQYTVDFEGQSETKTSYASGTVTLSGIDWNMTDALIGTDAADWKNGNRSARMRGHGTSAMTMLADKPNGAGTVSFQYRRYETDAQVDWRVELSSDGGVNWSQIGSDFTAPSDDNVQTFTHAANVAGGVRIRIVRATTSGTSNRRLNIDDITITDYSVGGNSIITGLIAGSPFCVNASNGASVSVPYTSTGSFTGTFTAQLSDANGDFTTPTAIGTGADPISASIPANTASGTGYRIRIVNDNPVFIGTESSPFEVINGTPEASNLLLSFQNQSLQVSWDNPASCFDEVIIVAHTSTISGTPSGTYTANSLDFTDGSNPAFPGGGVVVYNGSTSPQTITGLTNGTEYFIRIFARRGTVWSSVGVEGSETPALICGFEDFSSSSLTSSYADGSFVGNNAVTWTYIHSRDENGDANSSGINGKAIMLRRISDNSRITSSSVSGGVGNFSCKLYKGFTGVGNRQVELFINGISMGSSTPFDNFNEQIFTVNNINIPGDVIIEIRNITSTQVIVDDIQWSCYTADYVYESGSWTPSNPSGISTNANSIHIVDGTASISSATDSRVLSINSGAVLLIGSGHLIQSSQIHNNGSVTLQASSKTNYARLITNAASGSGTISQQMRLTPGTSFKWYAMGAPTAGITVPSIGNGLFTNTSVFSWHAVNGWTSAEASLFVRGKGLLIAAGENSPHGSFTITQNDENITFTGANPDNSSDISVPMDYGNAPAGVQFTDNSINQGWNLLANPYHADFDLNNLSADNGSGEKTLYIRTTLGYQAYGPATNTPSSARYLSPGEGFFVRATTTGQNFTFARSRRAAAGGDGLLRPTMLVDKVEVEVRKDSNTADVAYINFLDGATTNFDGMYDAHKLNNDDDYPTFYTEIGAYTYAINALPLLTGSYSLPAGFKTTTAGNYTISLANLQDMNPLIQVTLEDKRENTFTDLRIDDYTFNHLPNNAADRFILHFDYNAVSVQDFTSLQRLRAWVYENDAYVHAANDLGQMNLAVIDITGKVLYQNNVFINKGETQIALPTTLRKGVYMLKLSSSTENKIVKFSR